MTEKEGLAKQVPVVILCGDCCRPLRVIGWNHETKTVYVRPCQNCIDTAVEFKP
jgi:hypothetical protein